MSVYRITPYKISFKKNNHNNDFFRDSELFDTSKDKLNCGYRHYDQNDMPVFTHTKTYVDKNFMHIYELRDEPKYNIDTDEFITNTEIDIPRINKLQKTNNAEEKLKNAAFLKTKKKTVFSKPLYEYLKQKYHANGTTSKYYSIRELTDICEVCKLKKSNKSEYVDFDMLDAGLYWSNKIISNDNKELKQILRSMVKKDKNGNEYFDKNKNLMLKTLSVNGEWFRALTGIKLYK